MWKRLPAVLAASATLAFVALCGCKSAPSSEPLSFVVIGDNRPPAGADETAQPVAFLRAIKEINALQPDFVVIIGETISQRSRDPVVLNRLWDAFDAAAAGLKTPYYQVYGNQYNPALERAYAERYGSKSPLYYSFDVKGCHFIALNSDPASAYNFIDPAQLEWLKADLAGHRSARKTFAFMHKQMWWAESTKYSNWQNDVLPLLASYGVDTVFSGHVGAYVKNPDQQGVRLIITGGGGSDLRNYEYQGGFHHYCLVNVRGNERTIAVVKTGHIEDETLATPVMRNASAEMLAKLGDIGIRLGRGAKPSPLPDHFDMVLENTLDVPLTGTLSWDVPAGSPWKLPTDPLLIAVNVAPHAGRTIAAAVPPGGSIEDTTALQPFPTAVWNLKAGDLVFCENLRAPVTAEAWPYAATLRNVRHTARSGSREKIVLAKETSFTSRGFCFRNYTKYPLKETFAWRLSDNPGWKAIPESGVVEVPVGKVGAFTGTMTYSGPEDRIFPIPRLMSTAELDGEKVLERPFYFEFDAQGGIPVGRCVRAAAPPKVDGKLDDPAWSHAAGLSPFYTSDCGYLPESATAAAFLYDDERLYASFRCSEADMARLVQKTVGRDAPVWRDDSVTLWLTDGSDKPVTCRLGVSCSGAIFDSRDSDPDERWNGDWEVAVSRDADAWTVELAVPWKSLGMTPPKPGDKLRLQLDRHHPRAVMQTSEWSPVFVDEEPFLPRFGTVVFE